MSKIVGFEFSKKKMPLQMKALWFKISKLFKNFKVGRNLCVKQPI